ncbi:hypothetical protein DKX38_013575 [Salix brachista]|uniref:Reverse transcriptase zinc-binding domain-containing protein n=1 Tax=Salix brachista TaxID=2182728 RepID=A0A5N5LES7_9ROSI|nr:hypothetical protein DKX38_013575 [Salix brachista]
MVAFGSWNIWGLNGSNKQSAIRRWMHNHQLDIIGILETRVNASNLHSVQAKIAPTWRFYTNSINDTYCRIMAGWNVSVMKVKIIHSSTQWVTCKISEHSTLSGMRISFIYGMHTPEARRPLWHYILEASEEQRENPWVIMGDFNVVLRSSDREGGDRSWHSEFMDCINQAEVQQIPYNGMRGTTSGDFSISSAWNLMRASHDKVAFASMLWHPWHIPRHSFTLWLAIKERLRTIDRIHVGVEGEGGYICSLCNSQPETHDHLFFNCPYSKEVWRAVNVKTGVSWPEHHNWKQVWEWGARSFNGRKNHGHRIPCMALATTVYHLWYERNGRIFNGHFNSSLHKTKEIIATLRLKIASMEDRNAAMQVILERWGIKTIRGRGPGEGPSHLG